MLCYTDADSPCYNEVFYNFPILTNSTIEDDKRIFIRRIDNLGEGINVIDQDYLIY